MGKRRTLTLELKPQVALKALNGVKSSACG